MYKYIELNEEKKEILTKEVEYLLKQHEYNAIDIEKSLVIIRHTQHEVSRFE